MKRNELSYIYLSSFCMELSILLMAGITPYEGVFMLYEDETDENGKLVLMSLLQNLEKGMNISEALKETGYFPEYMVNMSEAGEKTGHLTETMKALSDYYNRLERFSIAIKNAVLYPSVLFIIMSAVVLILIIKVLPIFNDIFGRLGSQMSSFAVRLMQFGNLLAGFSATATAICVIFLIIAYIVWNMPAARNAVVKTMRSTFANHGIFRKISASRFISVMALAVTSGLDLETGAELAATISGGSKAADKRYKQCAGFIASGNTLSEAMLRTGIISPQNARFLSISARSGMTDAAMTEIAARCERDVQEELERLINILEPAIVIIASIIIGTILLFVMLPLMSIMTSIG